MGFRLTDRDIEIVRFVERFRLLRSRSHIVPLFGGSTHVLRRLQKLRKNQYLYELPGREPNEEAVYAIGNVGADLLNAEFNLPRPKVDYTQQNKTLGMRFIEHTLLVSDIIVAIILATRCRDDVRYISQEEIFREWAPRETRSKRYKVGAHPFRWRVKFSYKERTYRKSIEPDHIFGLAFPGQERKPNWFFLEADRQNMPVKSRNMNRSSIFKKQLQYWESWQDNTWTETNLFKKHFGVSNIRTLFVLDTGYQGRQRLNRCIEVTRHFEEQAKGGEGMGLFLFANAETLLDADDILNAPLVSGRGDEKILLG